MAAFIVLLLAALSRFLPHAFHAVGINFTAVGAGLLFFGARRPRWQAALAAVLMASTDVLLTLFVYGYKFEPSHYLVTWAWYALVCFIGSGLLRKTSFLRVAAGVLASSISFYVLVDFGIWAFSSMYPHTLAGLQACYVAAVPFLWNDLASTAIIAGALFGVPVAATWLAETMQAHQNNLPA